MRMMTMVGLFVATVLAGCAAPTEEATAEDQAELSAGSRIILTCTGGQGNASVAVEIAERSDRTHQAKVVVTRGQAPPVEYVEQVFGDTRRLGVNRLHAYFSSLSDDGFHLVEHFRKKLDTNQYRPAFIFPAEAIKTDLACTRRAETKFLD